MKRNNFLIKTLCLVVILSMLVISQPLFTDSNATYSYKNEDFKLGLYQEGSNEIPIEHLAKGLEIADEMRKMSKINITCIGHSVPWTTFNGWNWSSSVSQNKLAANTNFKDASVSAKMAWQWVSQLKGGNSAALGGFAKDDLHVLCVQLTWAPFFGPDSWEQNTPLSQKIDSMSHDLERLAKGAKQSFPNLKMILMQADPWQNNHEPYHAYHEWFFSRQVVLDQISKAADYIGPSVDEVWIGLGGYWWQPNASGSYYTDCCHISGTGATYYRQQWIEGLIKYNPVVSHWLLANPPEITKTWNAIPSLSPVQKLHSIVGANGVKVVFSLLDAAQVNMGLFSIDGRAVVPMSERDCRAGLNSIQLTADVPLASGAYIVRLNDGVTSRSLPLATIKR